MSRVRAASDVGGTFTDLVYFNIDQNTGEVRSVETEKAHTTPPNFEQGVARHKTDRALHADTDHHWVKITLVVRQ